MRVNSRGGLGWDKAVCVVLWIATCAPAAFAFLPGRVSQQDDLVKIRGAVTLRDGTAAGSEVDVRPQLVLRGRDGLTYRFGADDLLAQIFADHRVREQEVQITGRQRPGRQIEIIKVHLVRGELLVDVFYFCEVCNVTSFWPGLCPCCRAEMVYTEVPLSPQ